MKFNILNSLLCAVLLVQPQISAASEKILNAVATPEGVKTETIVLNLIQNGHRISIANLETNQTIESVLEFYREQWKQPLAEGIPGFVEEQAGEWFIISRPNDNWNQVVQMRDTKGGIEGRISVLELTPVSTTAQNIAMPSNASLVSSTAADDVGHNSNTYVIFSESGVNSVADFYRNHFDADGWSRVSDKHLNNAQVMLLQRRGERAELVVSRVSTGGTLTIINKVINDG